MQSKRKISQTSTRVACPKVAGSLNAETDAVARYLESAHAREHLTTKAEREALWYLALAAYESRSPEQVCMRVAIVLSTLRTWQSSPRIEETIGEAFGDALQPMARLFWATESGAERRTKRARKAA